MRKIIFFLSAFCILLSANGQTIKDLDEKNGFKEFTLGDDLFKWGAQLEYKGRNDDNSIIYTYTGNCCSKVFQYDIDDITLIFSERILVGIGITTKKLQKEYAVSGKYTRIRTDDFNNVKASLAYLFGEPTAYDVLENDASFMYSWMGKKVILILAYEYLGVSNGDRLNINVIDLDYVNKGVESGF